MNQNNSSSTATASGYYGNAPASNSSVGGNWNRPSIPSLPGEEDSLPPVVNVVMQQKDPTAKSVSTTNTTESPVLPSPPTQVMPSVATENQQQHTDADSLPDFDELAKRFEKLKKK
jgi:hypothetical protein